MAKSVYLVQQLLEEKLKQEENMTNKENHGLDSVQLQLITETQWCTL